MSNAYKGFSALIVVFMLAARADAAEVIPSGECVGVKLYTDGLVVVDTTEVTARDGKRVNIAADCGIEKGDVIKKLNGERMLSNEMITERLRELSGSGVTLTVSRGDRERDVSVMPADTEDGPKLGLWLRDSTAGLGTITCFTDDGFAALGHGICDVDTGCIMPVERGIIQDCTILSIAKGSGGAPGAIAGEIDGKTLGTITRNTDCGLFGTLDEKPFGEPIEVASKSEVHCGEAAILADADGAGVREYAIEIKRIAPPLFCSKDMVIKVTDEELLCKTGGIVQGMSGAPIIQDNKLVGAVTHVFVNDPTSGYGILAEHMLGAGG